MSMFRQTVCALAVAGALVTPAAAQESPLTVPNLTDQQKRGENLFLQRCPLCHQPSAEKKRNGIQASNDLRGHFKRPATNEAAVRRTVQEGIPGLMPAFRYSITGTDLNDLIAYLKVR